MAKSRKLKMTDAVYRPHRNGERLPAQELVDRATEELTRLARIPQENPDPVFRVSAEHVLLYSNPAGQELCRGWGCSLGQKVPTAIQTIVSAALADRAVARHKVVFGSHIYALTVAPAVADGYVNLYARDITDYKRAEEALRQAEQKFRTIFDNTSDGIFLMDLEARKFTMCNKSCLQMLGYTQEEFLNLGIADLHLPADLPFVHAQIEEFLKGGKPIRHDIRFKRKDGSLFFADLSPDLVWLDGKRHAVVALKDITERKRMEEELRRHAEHLEELVTARTAELQESETRYRSLYHTIADGIFVMGADGRIADVNDSACAQLGYTRAELIGLPVAAISARPGFHLGEILDRLQAAGSLSYETAHRHKDGTIIPVELSVARIEYRGQPAILGVARDTTERKRAEEALQFTQFAVDHTADAAFWMTEEGGFFYVNEAACQALGYSRAELLQMTVFDIDPAFTEGLWLESWRQLKAQKSIVLETVHQARDGRIYPVEIRANYLEFGGRAYDCAFARDITERKRAQAALLESEERYRILLEHGFDGIFVHEDFWVVQLNDRLAEMAGCARSDLGGKKLIDMFTADSQERIRQYTRSGASGYIELELRRPDGHLVKVESYGASCRFHGHEARIVGLRDITERKRAEEALRESEERFRTAFEEGAVAMALTALDSTLLKVNSSFCRMLGFDESELVGRSYAEITHPDDRAANRLGTQRVACGAIPSFHMEKRYIRKDGAVIWGDMSTASVRDAQGRPLYCVTHVQDVTDRKQAEEALRRLNERLELQVAQRTEELRHTVDRLQQLTLELSQAEDRERRRIADLLHDDVQQTLAAAKFHLNLLSSEPRSAEESQEIVEQVRRMLKDAIEKSRRLSHELSPALYQVDLTAILEWLARHMQQKHGLTVHVEARGPVDSPSEPLKAFLYKVAQELLFNVAKHAGVREARIRVRRLGPRLYLSVVDRGRGFDPQRLEMAPGFGLLGIRERIQLLGGRMKIKSAPGAGSTLLIALPYEPAARTQDAASPECQDASGTP